MVSRLDDDDEDNNEAGDDTSESERDNAQSVEIDVNNPDAVADVAKNLDINYRVESPSSKNELVTSWNDLDRPSKRMQKQNQYLTYYTNTSSNFTPVKNVPASEDASVNGRDTNVDNPTTSVPMNTTLASNALVSLINSHSGSRHQHDHHNGGDRYNATNLTTTSIVSTTATTIGANMAASAISYSNKTRVCNIVDESGHLVVSQRDQLSTTQQVPAQMSSTSGHAHAVTIDTSLTKLLECMSLYYSSKLTSPKWKSFKGLKLRMKYKIRLNNLIWRAWFLQCIRGRRPPGCQFTAPAETEVHKKNETIVLEGKYWKRKDTAIMEEYKKWRIFHSKQKSQSHCFRPVSLDATSFISFLYGAPPSFYLFFCVALISDLTRIQCDTFL